MPTIFTRGNNDNIACPHCGKTNHHVCSGILIQYPNSIHFKKECWLCKAIIYYEANWEITLVAEKNEQM